MTKTCKICGVDKPIAEFHKARKGKYGVETRCKTCKSEAGKRYRRENREEFRARKKQYYYENHEREKARRNEYSRRNQEAVRKRSLKRYYENPEYYHDLAKQRRVRKKGLPTEKFMNREIFDRDEWVCQLCGDLVDPDLRWPNPWSVSLDHVIPISNPNCPGHVWDNVWTTHLRCNLSKNARLLEEF